MSSAQVWVPSGLIHEIVKTRHEEVVGPDAFVIGVLRKPLGCALEISGQLSETGRIRPPSSEGGARGVQSCTSLEEGVDVLCGDMGDDDASAPVGFHESIGLQLLESFSEGGAGDAEALGLLHLSQDAAGLKPPLDDVPPELGVGQITCSHAPTVYKNSLTGKDPPAFTVIYQP